MTEFIANYVNLLLLQYYDKPNAIGTVEAFGAKYEELRNVILQFENHYNIDTAEGVNLDLLGKQIGLSRYLPDLPELTDEEYRTFLKAKILVNNVTAKLWTGQEVSLQDAVQALLGEESYAIDTLTMNMHIIVPESVSVDLLRSLKQLDLIPRPQGVGLGFYRTPEGDYFGFDGRNKGFADKFDPLREGAKFRRKLLL